MVTAMPRHVPPFWPDETELGLLRAALLPDQRAIHAWRQLDLSSVGARHETWSLLPLAFFNLKDLGVPINDMAEAAAAYNRTLDTNRVLAQAASETMASFLREGIDHVALKGLALLTTVYPDLGTRPMFDADVMVRSLDVKRAARVLGRAGYHPATPLEDALLATRASAQFVNADGIDIDLHWHALGGYVAEPFDDALWQGRVTTTSPLGMEMKVLSRAEQLTQVIGHALRAGWPGTRWWADIALLLRSSWTDDQWSRLGELASLFQMTLPMSGILTYLRDHVGIDVQREAFEVLERNRPSRSERIQRRALSRLDPGSTTAALLRSWATYAAVQAAGERRRGPVGFTRFTWRYLGSGSDAGNALEAIRRKLS